MTNEMKAHDILRTAPGIRILVESGASVRVEVGGKSHDCGPHTLEAINVFLQPRSLAEAIEHLKASVTGIEDWVELTSTIQRLITAGAIRPADDQAAVLRSDKTFDNPEIHVQMLNDRVRTSKFIQAIESTVRPGDIVVEIGTGTGILALAAARAGASHVYAIEAGAIGHLAQEMFRSNGFADRITLVPGWSTETSLPVKADVLISEIIGNDPLGEGVLRFTRDALRRLVKPKARLVPSALEIWAVGVTAPSGWVDRRTFSPNTADTWREWYGFDFGPAVQAAARTPHFSMLLAQQAREWVAVTERICLAEIDLGDPPHTIHADKPFPVVAEGRLDGVLIYFKACLAAGIDLPTDPRLADAANCWRSPMWLVPGGRRVKPGDRLRVSYGYRLSPEQNGIRVRLEGDGV
jgi:precorrin-6B methylase 2